jgi:hypothetical protein
MTAVTKNIPPGRFWTSQPIDAQEKQEMNKRLVELNGERDILKQQYHELQDKIQAIEDRRTSTHDNIVSQGCGLISSALMLMRSRLDSSQKRMPCKKNTKNGSLCLRRSVRTTE